MSTPCVLCDSVGGKLIWKNELVRVINAQDPNYPAYTRVIWQGHVKEMTDLSDADQQRLMRYVLAVERVQRHVFQPTKINLAQFGTQVPHIHWHIIPRFTWDLHYPNAIWATPNDPINPNEYQAHLDEQYDLLTRYYHELIQTLNTL